jgi:hypothetical protein
MKEEKAMYVKNRENKIRLTTMPNSLSASSPIDNHPSRQNGDEMRRQNLVLLGRD